MGLLENLPQHFKTLEFPESRNMKAIETHHHIYNTVSVSMRKTENVHILRGHSHKVDEITSFRRLQEITMTRSLTSKLPCSKVKIRIFRKLLKVWVETEETRHLKHKHKVEISRCGGRGVIPF